MLHEDGVNQTGMRPIQEVPIVEAESITAVVKDGMQTREMITTQKWQKH